MPVENPVHTNSERTTFFNDAAPRWGDEPDVHHRSYLAAMLQHLHRYAQPGNSILDIGCGTGILFPFLQQYKVTAIDLSPAMVIRAQSRKAENVKEVLVADAHALPFDDVRFNHAVMLAVFPHLHSQDIALKEVHRVLKKNGTLLILHIEPRNVVNTIHTAIGGVISEDILPEKDEMIALLRTAEFSTLHSETQTGFSFLAQKQ